MKIKYLTLLLLISFFCQGQSLFQSKEMNIRNDIFYDILKVGSKHLVLRNKSNSYIIERFNEELQYEGTTDLNFESNKIEVISVNDLDSVLQIIYSYINDANKNIINLVEFDQNINTVDSTISLFKSDLKLVDRKYKTVSSPDHLKSLLFGTNGKEMSFILVDNILKEIISKSSFSFQDFDHREDFKKIILTNEGKIILLFEKNNTKYQRENHILGIYYLVNEIDIIYTELSLKNTVNTGIQVAYNNVTSSIAIAGLYAEKDFDNLIGYFLFQSKLENTHPDEVKFAEFNSDIFEDLYGKKSRRKQNSLSDFYLSEIVQREDNGCLLISEMKKEFVRRSSYSNMSGYDGNGYSTRGFVDYYNEDILLINLDSEGKEDWNKLFYKKQFSQDDDAIYSSFFLLKTPSRLRFVYNDEIKKNSTVSEYVISPTGNFERNAIINTEYRGLQLRFKDAEQTGSNELIVPSEKDFKLSLIKLSLE